MFVVLSAVIGWLVRFISTSLMTESIVSALFVVRKQGDENNDNGKSTVDIEKVTAIDKIE